MSRRCSIACALMLAVAMTMVSAIAGATAPELQPKPSSELQPAPQEAPLPFVRGSQRHIVSSLAGQPFVLALWSLDCVYCRHDLALLSRLKMEHPQLRLVLVATDQAARRAEITPALATLGLDTEESWIFADGFTERLYYEIDPQWYGELPRTYFYEADGARTGISGKLEENAVSEWIRATHTKP